MQKLLVIVFILFPALLFSQNLPINLETKRVEYTGVVDIQGSKLELFSRGKSWVTHTFNASQDLMETKDEDHLSIKGLAIIDYTAPDQGSDLIEIPMHFTLTLDFTNNKYRYKFTNLYFDKINEPLAVIIPIEETILSREQQEGILAKRLLSENQGLSENEYKEALTRVVDQNDQFKSKGHWTIMGIIELLKNGLADENKNGGAL
jgi:hypothetical protein